MDDQTSSDSSDRLCGLRDWTPPALLLQKISRGEQAIKSIDDVLEVVRVRASTWDLHVHSPFQQLTYNFVAPATSSVHGLAVLKIAFDAKKFRREFTALLAFEGRGSVRVLEHDEASGAALLERADPGRPMNLGWDDRTAAFVGLVRELWRPAPPDMNLPAVTKEASYRAAELERMSRFLADSPFGNRVATVERARCLLAEIASSSDERYVLHGDLHSHNVLSSNRMPWLSIDPLGCVGERAFDVSALLRNESRELLEAADPQDMVDRRICDIASECGIDGQRIRTWSFIEAVRTQGWRYRSGKPLEEWSSVIALLEP
jgi:streptomycin 6-kinase